MEIALITIHNANNYGAILQAYATYNVLSRFGDVEIIDYENRHISISLDLIRIKFTKRGILGMGKDICRIIPRYKVIKKFEYFTSKYLKLTKKIDKNNINLKLYDLYVCGSDQIWNPNCISENGNIDEIYFLNFAPDSAKKISYASSLGNYKFNAVEQKKIDKLLRRFDSLSIREKDGKEHLENFINKDIKHVLDPTLLLSKEEWINKFNLEENINSAKYILVYSVPKSPLIRITVDYFSKKFGLKVISIDQGLNAGAKVDKHIKDAGPLEYLSLFLNAEFIITDSFHGTCFSINFAKQFVSVSPNIYANRIESLLSLVGLKNRIVKNKEDFGNISNLIEYSNVNNLLVELRNESLLYIKNSIV